MDSDYQFAAIDFWRLEPHRRAYDVILGIKVPRKDPFYRVILSKGYNWLLRRNKSVMDQTRAFAGDLHNVLLAGKR